MKKNVIFFQITGHVYTPTVAENELVSARNTYKKSKKQQEKRGVTQDVDMVLGEGGQTVPISKSFGTRFRSDCTLSDLGEKRSELCGN